MEHLKIVLPIKVLTMFVLMTVRMCLVVLVTFMLSIVASMTDKLSVVVAMDVVQGCGNNLSTHLFSSLLNPTSHNSELIKM